MESSGKSPHTPTAAEAFDGIGEKGIAAFSKSVMRAKADLATYRATFQQWVTEHSERGLANWINDRLWAHLTALADAIDGMEVVESGPTREVIFGYLYRCRFKRHHEDGTVASYETDAFLDFVCQPAAQLPGMEETRLIAGYEWSRDLREMGMPLISLRDGRDKIIWKEPLPMVAEEEGEGDTGPTAPVVTPDTPTPPAPTVEIPDTIGSEREDQTEGE